MYIYIIYIIYNIIYIYIYIYIYKLMNLLKIIHVIAISFTLLAIFRRQLMLYKRLTKLWNIFHTE